LLFPCAESMQQFGDRQGANRGIKGLIKTIVDVKPISKHTESVTGGQQTGEQCWFG